MFKIDRIDLIFYFYFLLTTELFVVNTSQQFAHFREHTYFITLPWESIKYLLLNYKFKEQVNKYLTIWSEKKLLFVFEVHITICLHLTAYTSHVSISLHQTLTFMPSAYTVRLGGLTRLGTDRRSSPFGGQMASLTCG